MWSGFSRRGGVAVGSDIFRRDVFSFWAPLDQQFLYEMARLARAATANLLADNFSATGLYDKELIATAAAPQSGN